MKTFLLAFLLVGCGGQSFSTLGADETDGGAGTGGSAGVSDDGGGLGGAGGAADALGGNGGTFLRDSGTGGKVAVEVDAGAGGTTSAGGTTASGGTTAGSGGTTSSGGSSSTGGATGSGGTVACTLVTHSDGLGQTWQDCAPLGTYDEAEAMAACKAWCAVNGGCVCQDAWSCVSGDESEHVVEAMTGGEIFTLTTWLWQGNDVEQGVYGTSPCHAVGTWN